MRLPRFFIAIVATAALMACQSFGRRDAAPATTTAASAALPLAYRGWAAILGGGAQAQSGSDWHMTRDLRIDVDRDAVPIRWRDGQASGHALLLQRITLQHDPQPLLKLSIVDGKGQVVAYAWSQADAQRIGISLGWIQVGLEPIRDASSPP